MIDISKLKQGAIVWARVADPKGMVKDRPLVIVTSSEDILLDRPIVGLAITTTFPEPPPSDCIPIPWSKRGHPSTGLKRRSAVVGRWAVVLKPSDIEQIGGFLPTKHLVEVMELHRQLISERQSSSD